MNKYRWQLWWVARGAGLLFVPTFICFVLLDGSFFGNRPKEPHPEFGFAVPYTVKGVRIYVTETEWNVATWLYRFDMGLLSILAICGVLAGGLDLSRRNLGH